jgi:hemolysin activation/secretion protein
MNLHTRSCLWAALCLSTGGVFAQAPAAPAPAASAASAPADAQPRFDILEFQVEGNSVLPDAAIERAVTPFLGPGRQMDDVEGARAALEKVYQGGGYLTVFVDVPEQRIQDGVVVLHVTEGRVERLKVSGSRYFDQGWIRSHVTELAEGKVPNFNEVQRQLALVNRTEERRVQPLMRAGVAPGTVDTELKVSDKLPLFGSLEIDNHAAANTTPLRAAATLRYENLFQRDQSLSLTVATAPVHPSQSRVISLNYAIPGAEQSTWILYGLNSDSDVAAVGGVDVLGKGTTLGFRWVRPFGNIEGQSHSVSLGADYKDVKQDVNAAGSVVSTPLHYLPLQFAYNGGFDEGRLGSTQVAVTSTIAFRSILERQNRSCPGGSQDQFACQRQDGDGSFATLRADLRQAVPLPWSGWGSLHGHFAVQGATGPLPNGEQFAIGGADTVRGYREAEAAGDRGLLASIEWHSADLSRLFSRPASGDDKAAAPTGWSQTYALVFAEGAREWVFSPAAGQYPHQALGSVGLGWRMRPTRWLSGELDLARPFRATINTPAHETRASFKLAVDY